MTCQGRDGSKSELCGEDKPNTERKCHNHCLDSEDSDLWDGQYISLYIENDGSERTDSSNLTHLAEFLELPSRCSKMCGFTYILLIQVIHGRND